MGDIQSALTAKERFLLAFSHKEADRVPVFDIINNPQLYKRALGSENYFSDGDLIVRAYRSLGMDACFVPVGGYTGLIGRYHDWTSAHSFTDEFGVRFQVNDSSWPLAIPVESSLTMRSDWDRFSMPDPHASWRFEELRKAIAATRQNGKDSIAVIAGIRGSFAAMYIGIGIENLAIALYDDPSFIDQVSSELTAFWTAIAVRCAEIGADAVYIANDMGLNTGTIISPDQLRGCFIPHLARQVSEIRRTGMKVILHSCGNVNAILDDLVATGIDGLNNLQVAAGMDIARVKAEYGDALTILGNVDATNVMPRTEPDVIENAVRRTIAIAAPGGGHVLATDHSFHMGIPIENVDRFFAASRRWGGYPINEEPLAG